MEKLDYRVRAVLARIRSTLDRFSLRLEVDWNYDVQEVLEEILVLAVGELEFGDGTPVDRALLITQDLQGGQLETGAGWSAQDDDLTFSRTIVEETIRGGVSVLCPDAMEDDRFRSSESLRGFDVLTLLSVPLKAGDEVIGALYIERRDARHLFGERDQAFAEALAETISPLIRTAVIYQNHVRVEPHDAAQQHGERYSCLIVDLHLVRLGNLVLHGVFHGNYVQLRSVQRHYRRS